MPRKFGRAFWRANRVVPLKPNREESFSISRQSTGEVFTDDIEKINKSINRLSQEISIKSPVRKGLVGKRKTLSADVKDKIKDLVVSDKEVKEIPIDQLRAVVDELMDKKRKLEIKKESKKGIAEMVRSDIFEPSVPLRMIEEQKRLFGSGGLFAPPNSKRINYLQSIEVEPQIPSLE